MLYTLIFQREMFLYTIFYVLKCNKDCVFQSHYIILILLFFNPFEYKVSIGGNSVKIHPSRLEPPKRA